MMSAKCSDFFPSPLSAFASDLYYKFHATSLNTSAFPRPLSPSDAYIISRSSQRAVKVRKAARRLGEVTKEREMKGRGGVWRVFSVSVVSTAN